MFSRNWFAALSLVAALVGVPSAFAQRPYIGFVYPAGGQQGTTFRVKLGGQGLEDVKEALVSGAGVSVRIVEYNRQLGPQEITLLNEQLRELKRNKTAVAANMMSDNMMMMSSGTGANKVMMDNPMLVCEPPKLAPGEINIPGLMGRIQRRISEWANRPASAALASIVYAEVTVSPDAAPGEREFRLGTIRGISNPLVFYVSQLPEVARRPMATAYFQVLGKEELAKRTRPTNEVEVRLTIPCVANGQIASGEVNRYRFTAQKGQKLVISARARQLIPYLADAVPGWFQPVLVVHDAKGKELAYDDDYRFKPDPTILFNVPADGEYVFSIYDSIYRGREDFVYRVTIGELPFITSIFPLGCRVGETAPIQMKGWNLDNAIIQSPSVAAKAGVHMLTANKAGFISNRVPFAMDDLPETFEKEPNNSLGHAQKVQLPIIINGRIEKPDEWDVYEFEGKAGEAVVAEVNARRLDSPLDSVLKITDAEGKVLAFNDDREDPAAGVNTHHADSYIMTKLPADGTYFVHIGDTDRHGGEEYAYRLRISAPQPDFALRVVPSSLGLRLKNTGGVNVYALRKDGFTNMIKVTLQNPPLGVTSPPSWLVTTQMTTYLSMKNSLLVSKEPVTLHIVGTAKVGAKEIVHEAVPAEDRMQAFLWRHLVPAQELKLWGYDPAYVPPPKRVPVATPMRAPELKQIVATTTNAAPMPKFTKSQVAGRLRQLKLLFEEGLLTDAFYNEKVAECEAAQ